MLRLLPPHSPDLNRQSVLRQIGEWRRDGHGLVVAAEAASENDLQPQASFIKLCAAFSH
ncbi:hypothetical protein EHW99_0202 [Erwinia amylovora]|uniref:Uncharacterized protein n=2 Tax=Erwinia amylovora TaxID=552 RepID=A0A830ZW92_ERWAM|nr:hypothetical protein EaACW_0207 [Erwinia amylovora ACW56400]QJQ52909.1 hypothetical protein EHX00_0202 [Erwinia amylovora]CBA19144.1 hypothetical protein predicted by Glimmer/Critica [Erwinia amylovora CFBP1430]CCO77052.1 hypothetical protein BN432_0212 [Erwinia amylovora Ea356]CCO80832.1 hypothetical protein BN433_0217 [Erwinia amylovora Ea266]CCO84640.1 hypothetical protein BN434_0209 [Erwinia amylovora CFBP 2585]CCO88427.1 hypothetical protein BN435_0213 [Erwinia amylovora 01SFR-BO]CCO